MIARDTFAVFNAAMAKNTPISFSPGRNKTIPEHILTHCMHQSRAGLSNSAASTGRARALMNTAFVLPMRAWPHPVRGYRAGVHSANVTVLFE